MLHDDAAILIGCFLLFRYHERQYIESMPMMTMATTRMMNERMTIRAIAYGGGDDSELPDSTADTFTAAVGVALTTKITPYNNTRQMLTALRGEPENACMHA